MHTKISMVLQSPARLKGKTLRLLPAAKSTAPVRGGKHVIGNP